VNRISLLALYEVSIVFLQVRERSRDRFIFALKVDALELAAC